MVVSELAPISGMDLAQRHNDRLAQGQGAVLLLEAVAKDDGVVDGECQLQDARHGIGDERDFAHHEVRALIEHERDTKVKIRTGTSP